MQIIMVNIVYVGILFIAFANVFLGIAFRDFLKEEGKFTTARRNWIQISFIFTAVAIGLYFLHLFIRLPR